MITGVPAKWAIGTAGVWCVGLIVAAGVVPAYRGSTETSSSFSAMAGASPTTVVTANVSRTLVQENGAKVLLVVAVPLLLVVAVALLLPRHRRLAWAVTVVVFGFVLAGAFTIGPFVYPVGVLLVVACALEYSEP
jgi:hypothetical protein